MSFAQIKAISLQQYIYAPATATLVLPAEDR